ncbi:hypothetical protein ACTWPB_08975 [Nocardia sp. IBHARD005]|uniref:hypothetical protein n=1 Tax=Nocardia sp. IBHARD005 TaxID=3457765 RepID=UPI00405A13C8
MDGVEAVGLLLVGAWSSVVGAWVVAGLDGFGWAADESAGAAGGVAGASTDGRSSEDAGGADGLVWLVGLEVLPGVVGFVPLGDPVGFGFVVPVSLGDEGVPLPVGAAGLVDAGLGLLGESGEPVLEGFPLSAGVEGLVSAGLGLLGESGEFVLEGFPLSSGDVGPGEVSPGELGLGVLPPGEVGELSPGELELGELSPGELGLGELSLGELLLGELGLGELSPGALGLGLGLGEPSPDGVDGPPSPVGLSFDDEPSPGDEGEPAPEGWVALSPLGVDGAPSDAGAVEPGAPVDAGEVDWGVVLFGWPGVDEPGSSVPAGLVGESVSPNSGTVGAGESPLPPKLDCNPLCSPPAPALVNVSTPISSVNS